MSVIGHWVRLTPKMVMVDGRMIDHTETGSGLITEMYKRQICDYPKYYKMGPLSRVGFVASELLLKAEDAGDKTSGATRGVVLFNKSSSLADDEKYQNTIADEEAFYPSPSLFVYTLPNVVTGEIAIRNHYYGETNFYVLDHADPQVMAETICNTFADTETESIMTGWCECSDENTFDVLMFIVEKDADAKMLSLEIENKLNIKQ